MLQRQYFAILTFFALLSTPLFSQPFRCDGSILFSYNQEGAPHQLYKVLFGPFGVVTYSNERIFPTGNFNALGFNPSDNYIYAVHATSKEIVRLKSDGTYDSLGLPDGVDPISTNAGDCTPEGNYLCYDNELNQVLIFDVVEDFALIRRLNLFWDPSSQNSGPFSTRIDDIAIDPLNPTVAYSYQGDYFNADLLPDETRGYLLKINLDFSDPNVGMVTPVGRIPSDVIRQMGSLIFSPSGSLYGYGSKTPGPSLRQNTLVYINKNSGESSAHPTTGPSGLRSDGCSCPYNISFQNIAEPKDILCTNSELTYMLSINNRFFQDVKDITLTDTIPVGMVIESVTGNFVGSIAPGTGVGTRILTLTELQLPAQSIVNINIKVRVNDVPIDLIANQAFLMDLPERFGAVIVSDDPSTDFVGDVTKVFGNAQDLTNVELDITNPTDCLSADDASVILSSPILIPGQSYAVNLRNQNFELSAFDVTIDDANSFRLDSLWPGKYKLTSITPKTSLCSFAMKDTTIDIIAPNDQLQATASSNSPLCELSTLELSSSMSPVGDVQWRGPALFSSEDRNPSIEMAQPTQSGTYEMIATYGVCEQVREVEVDIAPQVKAMISGKLQYCEREPLQLIAQGEGEELSFDWSGPNGLSNREQNTDISAMSFRNAGDYEVVISNGSCQDTASVMVTVVPSPTIALPEYIETQFCDPLVLAPSLTGDTEVDYSWSPSIGLSCDDCPNPEVLVPILPRFEVQVINEYACSDSAAVDIYLDESRLIYVPNAFSPNSDGVNDYFNPSPGCGLVRIIRVQVQDRSGAVVFSAGSLNNYDQELFWDGNIRGQRATPGVYFWDIGLELVDGTTKWLQGSVTLVR